VSDRPAPTPSGNFLHGEADSILRWCEAQRFTGTLTVTVDRVPADIHLLAGVPEVASARESDPDHGADPVARALDRFLEAPRGSYTLRQHLPPIEGAETSSERVVRGPLALRSPADIMRYCELAGLTGQLLLRLDHDDHAGECTALYERGELVSLTLDGREDLDVGAIFDWSTGRFEVTAFPLFDRDPSRRDPLLGAPPSPEEAQLLRTVEVALADILTQRAQAPSLSPRNPSFRPPPPRSADPSAPVVVPPSPRTPRFEPPPPSPDTTVKVYFVQARRPPVVSPQGAPAPAAPVLAGDLVGPPALSRIELGLWAILGLTGLVAVFSILRLLRGG